MPSLAATARKGAVNLSELYQQGSMLWLAQQADKTAPFGTAEISDAHSSMKPRSTGGEDLSDANEERKKQPGGKKKTHAFLSCPAVQLVPQSPFCSLQVGQEFLVVQPWKEYALGILWYNTDTQPTERKQNVSNIQQGTTLAMLVRKQAAFLYATSSSGLAWSTCFELIASKANWGQLWRLVS